MASLTAGEIAILIKAHDGASRVMNDVASTAKRMGIDFEDIKRRVAVASAAFGAAIGFMGKSVIDASAESERYKLTLIKLMGSVEEANLVFKDQAAYAAKVPFEYREIMGAAVALAGVLKGGREEINRYMPIIADLAAVYSMSIEDVTGQIIKMYSGSAAAADTFRDRGILAMMGFQTGVSISAEETRRKLIAAWEDPASKFRGATTDLATSWTGLISMLSDRWFQFRNMIGEAGFFDAAKNAISGLLDRLEDAATSGVLEQIATSISNLISGVVRGMGWVMSKFGEVLNYISTHPTAGTLGIIGFALMGPKGLALFSIVGGAIDEIFEKLTGGSTAESRLTRQIAALADEADRVRERIALIRGTIDDFNERGLRGTVVWNAATEALAEWEGKLATAEAQIRVLYRALQDPAIRETPNTLGLIGQGLIDLGALLGDFNIDMGGAGKKTKETTEAIVEQYDYLKSGIQYYTLTNDEILAWIKLQDEGAKLTEQMITPLEEYNAELARLDNMLAEHAITQETYNRAVRKAGEALYGIPGILSAIQTPLEEYNEAIALAGEALDRELIDPEQYARYAIFLKDELDKATRPAVTTAEEAGKDIGEALVSGIVRRDTWETLKRTLLFIVEHYITKVFTAALGIASPSRVAIGWGQSVAEGYRIGLEGSAWALPPAFTRLPLAGAAPPGTPAPAPVGSGAAPATSTPSVVHHHYHLGFGTEGETQRAGWAAHRAQDSAVRYV